MLFYLCNVLIISFLKQVVKRTNTNFYYKTFYITLTLTKNTEILQKSDTFYNTRHYIISQIPRVNV